MVGEKPHAFRRASLRRDHRRRGRFGLELREAVVSRRRDGKAAHDGANTVELEGSECARKHWRDSGGISLEACVEALLVYVQPEGLTKSVPSPPQAVLPTS